MPPDRQIESVYVIDTKITTEKWTIMQTANILAPSVSKKVKMILTYTRYCKTLDIIRIVSN